jgi:hypothetical protein
VARRRIEPNLFDLKGGGVMVSWTTASITGQPQLTYDDGGEPLTFGPDELQISPSPMGRLVTADIEVVPDSHSTSLVLVVPPVNLAGRRPQRVRTVAIVTRRETPFAPELPTGQLQSYKVLRLSGTASRVEA